MQGNAYVRERIPQSLAAGQVADSVGTIFTATGPTVLTAFTLYQSSATPQTINVYVTRSGGSRRQLFRFAAVAQYVTSVVLSEGEVLSLSSGDIVEADTTTAAVVDYYLSGDVLA